MAVTQFEDIYLDLSQKKGRLRLADSGLGWKAPGSDQPFTVAAGDIRKATWSRAARGFELKFTLKSGNFVRLDGFNADDIDALKEPVKSYYNVTIETREHSYKGWNWGKTDFSGQELLFNVNSKPAFEIPLSTLSNANLSGKNEVALEFSLPGDGTKDGAKEKAGQVDQLVEMRFYIPGTAVKEGSDKGSGDEQNDQEEMSAANLFYETIKDKADIGQVAGESIVSFQDLLFVTPRGRYDVDMYPSSLRLRGKTYDYKIPYNSIAKLFLLPKPDEMHVIFVVGLDPPLRQGQTRYPFLVAQFQREEEIEVELNLEDDEFKAKYSEKLRKSYDAPTYEVVSQIFRGLSGRKVSTPSSFK
ncbi:FACT complex subunit pob3, partial [Neolecta irregularis DAH-3]